MIIVYAAVAGQSVVKLYAAAMFPGFFLSFLYLVYIIGWALINPKIAPPLPEEQTRVPVPAWVRKFQAGLFAQHVRRAAHGAALAGEGKAIETDGGRVGYWMLLKNLSAALVPFMLVAGTLCDCLVVRRHSSAGGRGGRRDRGAAAGHAGLSTEAATPAEQGPTAEFYLWFWGIAAVCGAAAGALLLGG